MPSPVVGGNIQLILAASQPSSLWIDLSARKGYVPKNNSLLSGVWGLAGWLAGGWGDFSWLGKVGNLSILSSQPVAIEYIYL
jgi:hypothetical protein